MPINSVSSSTSSEQVAVQQTRQPQEAKKTLRADAENSVSNAEKAQQARRQEAQKTQEPKPVTNTQGQRTGTTINTTA